MPQRIAIIKFYRGYSLLKLAGTVFVTGESRKLLAAIRHIHLVLIRCMVLSPRQTLCITFQIWYEEAGFAKASFFKYDGAGPASRQVDTSDVRAEVCSISVYQRIPRAVVQPGYLITLQQHNPCATVVSGCYWHIKKRPPSHHMFVTDNGSRSIRYHVAPYARSCHRTRFCF